MVTTNKMYDIVLFGVTGFTGKLAAEYLLEQCINNDDSNLRWACSARNKAKADKVLTELTKTLQSKNPEIVLEAPDILQVDLLCKTAAEEGTLREIVQSTKVCLTCSGPFELYGKKLVQMCAEEGVHYADITGETDFVREMIVKHDKSARESGACIIPHCGNDCIPSDLTVLEMNNYAKQKGFELTEVQLYEEYGADASWSGGTLATASYQMGKDRTTIDKRSFDPLLKTAEGSKSVFATKSATSKTKTKAPAEIGYGTSGPWLMGPVMVSCIKRSNALLGYAKDFKCGDSFLVKDDSWSSTFRQLMNGIILYAAILFPKLSGAIIPQPGEGPDREAMEKGYLIVHGIGKIANGTDGVAEEKVKAKFHFNKDTGYLYTAVLLVETGILLAEKSASVTGGVLTPASALGSDLTQRILKKMDTSFKVEGLNDGIETP